MPAFGQVMYVGELLNFQIFDTSPGFAMSSINAILAADDPILVIKMDHLDIVGTYHLIKGVYDQTLGKKPELVVNKYWEKLEFERILRECHFNQKQIDISKVLILGRLINPGSELGTFKWFNKRTSLIEMTKEDLSGKKIY